jgi:hypothetical protein
LLLRGAESELVCFVDDHVAHLLLSPIIREREFDSKCEGVGSEKIFRQTNRLTPTDIHLPPTQWAMPYHSLRRESSIGLKIKKTP